MGSHEARTINELFNRAIERRSEQVVMSYKREKKWRDITGAQLAEAVRDLTVGLYLQGIRHGDRVALLADSSPDWSITDFAILATGAINVPIYPTQALDQVEFILRESEAKVIFVSGN